ncbi:MAG: hypothetical protein U0637_12815 [Phycisphaerales bacterium]
MTLNAALRWTLLLASLLAIGPLCSSLMGASRDADGGRAVSMLVGGDTPHTLGAGLLIFAGALAVGWVGSRFFSISIGFSCAGFVIAWGAWRTGTFDAMIRRTHTGAELPMLACEGALALLASAAIAWICWHASRAHRPGGPPKPEHQTFLSHFATARDAGAVPRVAVISIALSAAAGAAAAYFAAATPMKGQAVFAAFLGAIAAGAASQFAAQSMQGSTTPVSVVLGLALPAIAGPLLAKGDASLTAHTYANTVLPLAKVMPLDWSAGALLGAPVGLGWAGAMLDVRMV